MVLDTTFVIVTASLFIQVAVLALLIYGYHLCRHLKFRQHGVIMAYAVFVQVAAVFAIMVPSFVLAVLPLYIISNTLELTSLVSLIHEITGGLAFVLGVWFVASWRFQKSFSGCFNKKRLMLVTMTVWLIALTFGITLYSIFNWSIMMG
jgi:hypothetical protein